MLSASGAFHALFERSSKALVKATLQFADGSTRELTGDDIMDGGVSFEQSTSASGVFEIGACVVGRCGLSLNNHDGRFDDAVFTGATVTVFVGAPLESGTEWLCKGVYDVEQPDTYGPAIALESYDMLGRLDVPYSQVPRSYPASLRQIVADLAEPCGVSFANPSFPGCDYVVRERPSDDMTCRDVLSYAAQLAGCFARCDNDGSIRLTWYSDGSLISLSALASISVMTDDVTVTGLRLESVDYLDSGQPKYEGASKATRGEPGYVLSVSGNPFLQGSIDSGLLDYLWGRISGMRFRPFEASGVGDPTHEPGDSIELVDASGRTYRSYATSVRHSIGSYAAYACEAEYPGRNASTSYGALTRAVSRIGKAVARERQAREIALANLMAQLSTSSGVYTTHDEQDDGSTVYYLHDKPTLAESQTVWRMSAEAIAVSTDGGATYANGLDASGNAILNKIYAVGLNADYIDTGAIEVKNAAGKVLLHADIDTGRVYLQDATGSNSWDLSTGELSLQSVDFDLGSVNLAPDAGAMTSWKRYGGWTLSDGVATCPAPASASWDHCIELPALAWGDISGRNLTISFDVKTSGAWGAPSFGNCVAVDFRATSAADGDHSGRRTPWITAAPKNAWTRVSVTLKMTKDAFAVSWNPEWLGMRIYNRSNHQLCIRRVQVERGAYPTDWSPAPGDAVSEANAHSDARSQQVVDALAAHTSRLRALENGFSARQKQAMDAYLSSSKTMKLLTDNGKVKGIWLQGGKLYISGTAIETGSLSASVMRVGLLASKKAWTYYSKNKNFGSNTYFNIETGFLQAKGAKLVDASISGSADVKGSFRSGKETGRWIAVKNGTIYGYSGSENVGKIHYSSCSWNDARKKFEYGLALVGKHHIRLSAPAVTVATAESGRSQKAYTGTLRLNNVTFFQPGANRYCYGPVEMKFVNGLLVSFVKPQGI